MTSAESSWLHPHNTFTHIFVLPTAIGREQERYWLLGRWTDCQRWPVLRFRGSLSWSAKLNGLRIRQHTLRTLFCHSLDASESSDWIPFYLKAMVVLSLAMSAPTITKLRCEIIFKWDSCKLMALSDFSKVGDWKRKKVKTNSIAIIQVVVQTHILGGFLIITGRY